MGQEIEEPRLRVLTSACGPFSFYQETSAETFASLGVSRSPNMESTKEIRRTVRAFEISPAHVCVIHPLGGFQRAFATLSRCHQRGLWSRALTATDACVWIRGQMAAGLADTSQFLPVFLRLGPRSKGLPFCSWELRSEKGPGWA